MSFKETTSSFYQQVYSISFEDMIDVWVESFHPFGTVLVICDAGNYFKLLQDCGILCSKINSYNNKILTVEVLGVDQALGVMDKIKSMGYYPVMYLYDNAKLVLDNIEP